MSYDLTSFKLIEAKIFKDSKNAKQEVIERKSFLYYQSYHFIDCIASKMLKIINVYKNSTYYK